MHRTFSTIAVAALLGLPAIHIGCSQDSQPGRTQATKPGEGTVAQVALCTDCGQIKGSALCCQAGQETCAKCGLVKGSPGCCKITKGSSEPVFLCTKCGFIKGSPECCKPGQPTCEKCGLVKGSPGCCKIPKGF